MQISRSRGFSKQTNLTLFMLGILIVIIIIFSLTIPAFSSVSNFRNVMAQQANLIIVGLVVSMLLVTGNFDLSIGSVVAMGGVLCAYFSQSRVATDAIQGRGLGLNYGVAVLLTLMLCAVIGLINAFFIVKTGVASVIVTLGTMSIGRGVAMIVGRGAGRDIGLPPSFRVLGNIQIGPIALTVLIMIVMVLVFVFIEKKTVFGRQNYYIGANKEVAELSGINSKRQLAILYVASSVIAGFAGILIASRFAAGDANIAVGYEFDAIVAAVVGGASIFGGSGTVIGLVIGAYILGALQNALNLLGVATDWQDVAKGLVLIVAILAQRFAREKL